MNQVLESATGFSRRLASIDAYIERECNASRVPGAAYLVWQGGKIARQAALGLQDPGSGRAMALDSIFRIYSMTKPVVSVAVMMLAEQGWLSLAEPISRYFPELSGLMVGVEEASPTGPQLRLEAARSEITIHDLLRHTSGITYSVFGESLVKAMYRSSPMEQKQHANQDMVAELAKLPLCCHPGAGWEYGRSTDVLGALAERVSGEPLDVFLARRIFTPLGMRDTGFFVPSDKQHRLAQASTHDPASGERIRLVNVSRKPVWLAGGHGLVSTLGDYLRFARMLAEGGTLDGIRILGKATVAYMTSDHLDGLPVDRQHPSYLPGPGYGFGLGFAVRTELGNAPMPGSVGDYGWSGMAGTYFWVDPARELVAIWMMQAPAMAEQARRRFRNMVYAAF